MKHARIPKHAFRPRLQPRRTHKPNPEHAVRVLAIERVEWRAPAFCPRCWTPLPVYCEFCSCGMTFRTLREK
jgi:hypothetical protein